MKRITTITALFLSLIILSAAGNFLFADGGKQIKKKKVPPAVLAAFEKAYPNAKVEGYEKIKQNKEDLYEIDITDGATARSATYDAKGTLIETGETIDVKDVPETVVKSFTSENPKAKITKAQRITRGTIVEYKVSVDDGKKKKHVVLDALGKLLKKKDKEPEKK